MPPKTQKSGESRQGLIITIVFLVLLVIGLGVTSYYGFAYQEDLKTEAAKAKVDKAAITKVRDWEKFKALLFKAYIGVDVSQDDLSALAINWDKYRNNQIGTGEPDKAAVDELIAKLRKSPGWDDNLVKPTTTLVARVDTLNQKVKELEASQTTAETNTAQELEKYKGLLEANEKAKVALEAQFKAAEDKTGKEMEAYASKFTEATQTIAQRDATIAKLQEEERTAKNELQKTIAKLTKEAEGQKRNIEKLQELHTPKVDLTKYDQPKGKIVSIDRRGSFAYINVGSADRAKPQLTFSVFGVGPDGKAEGGERKAALEIVNVVEAHLSQARITEVKDPNRNPVTNGDLIFNPAWSPNLQQHIALAGLVDLSGDGSDHTQEFIRELRKQNIIVDSYMDLNDLTIKGSGMTPLTSYLVVGDNPEFDTSGVTMATPGSDRKMKVLGKISEMKDEANRQGISVIPVRRFLALIGYPLPRTSAPADYSGRPGGVGVKVPAKEPAKEEKAPPTEK